jgi:glycosyltransferase involved in cell wall biosynthesis
MLPRIYLDLSRLIYASFTRTPVGIPRIELAYAEYFIANFPDRVKFVVVDAFRRFRVLDFRRSAEFVTAISDYWRSDVASNRRYLALLWRHVHIHAELLFQWGSSLSKAVEEDSEPGVYVIASQLHMERPGSIECLKKSGKLRLVYYVHDILPVVLPEYFPPDAKELCLRRMQAAARLADTIIASSQSTANAFLETFRNGQGESSIVVASPGLSIPMITPKPIQVSASSPYFVMIGTIEPRKNHLLILNLWRTLRAELSQEPPRLILVGSRGWENENVIDMLERSSALTTLVEERGRTSDNELATLLLGARALLMPSFAEGYGLPLAEALALGTPVICSDIAVFREAGGEVPEFIDPLDGLSWREAIIDYVPPDSKRRQAQIDRLRNWSAPTWQRHFEIVVPLLGETNKQPEPPYPQELQGAATKGSSHEGATALQEDARGI